MCALTKRWLQHASVLLTVANWLDLWGVHQAPEVVLVVGPIQAQPQAWACQAYHRCDAGGCGVPRVLGLQLHPRLELVNWRCETLDVDDRQVLDGEWQHNNRRGERVEEKYSNYQSCTPVWSKKRVQRLHPSLSGISPNWNVLKNKRSNKNSHHIMLRCYSHHGEFDVFKFLLILSWILHALLCYVSPQHKTTKRHKA